MRVLFIGLVWPEPGSSAAGSRIVQLLDAFLYAGWSVHFACAAAVTEHSLNLTALNIATHDVVLNSNSFDDFVAELRPGIVVFDRFVTEEQFGWRVAAACPEALRILDTEDLHSLRHAREQCLRQAQVGQIKGEDIAGPVLADAAQLYPLMASSELAQREIAAIYRSDLTLMISTVEIDLLVNHFGVPEFLLHHTPFMLESTDIVRPSFEQRRDFVTIGNFRHAPNWDAVLWLKQTLWPKIRQQVPGSKLHIYGAYVMPKATQLHNEREGFLIRGRAENALTVLASARVCLAPLRFGAGLKGKLLDAMQVGTPSVTTSIGSEGMLEKGSWPGAVCDSIDEFVQASVHLYQDSERWQSAHVAADQLLANFDLSEHREALLARVMDLNNRRVEHRQQNFIGAMLNHHLHKSTQYMSQWIEAKTRLKDLS